MEVDGLPLPPGAPPFNEFRVAYSRAKWMGPGRGVVDPVREKKGASMGLEIGLSTLEDECSEMNGSDWREKLSQRAIEIKRFKDLGIPIPNWNDEPDEQDDSSSSTRNVRGEYDQD